MMRWNSPQSKPHPLASPPQPSALDRLWRWARRGNRIPTVYTEPAQVPPKREPCTVFRVPTAIEEEACMTDWRTDLDATRIAWNNFLVIANQGGFIGIDDIANLARAIQRYGDDREERLREELRRETE